MYTKCILKPKADEVDSWRQQAQVCVNPSSENIPDDDDYVSGVVLIRR